MKVTEYKGHKVPKGATKVGLNLNGSFAFYEMINENPHMFCNVDNVWRKQTCHDQWYAATELPEQPTKADDVIEHDNNNKYSRKIKTIVVDGIDHDIYVDVYDVLTAFKTDNPAVDHAVKKELAPGVRGVKSRIQDFMEARDSLNRAIEIEKAKGGE